VLDRAAGDDLDDRVEATTLALRAAAVEQEMPISGSAVMTGSARLALRNLSGSSPKRWRKGDPKAKLLHATASRSVAHA
jgi:hypothetical protein